jgi:hypothetical protein
MYPRSLTPVQCSHARQNYSRLHASSSSLVSTAGSSKTRSVSIQQHLLLLARQTGYPRATYTSWEAGVLGVSPCRVCRHSCRLMRKGPFQPSRPSTGHTPQQIRPSPGLPCFRVPVHPFHYRTERKAIRGRSKPHQSTTQSPDTTTPLTL